MKLEKITELSISDLNCVFGLFRLPRENEIPVIRHSREGGNPARSQNSNQTDINILIVFEFLGIFSPINSQIFKYDRYIPVLSSYIRKRTSLIPIRFEFFVYFDGASYA